MKNKLNILDLDKALFFVPADTFKELNEIRLEKLKKNLKIDKADINGYSFIYAPAMQIDEKSYIKDSDVFLESCCIIKNDLSIIYHLSIGNPTSIPCLKYDIFKLNDVSVLECFRQESSYSKDCFCEVEDLFKCILIKIRPFLIHKSLYAYDENMLKEQCTKFLKSVDKLLYDNGRHLEIKSVIESSILNSEILMIDKHKENLTKKLKI